MQNFDVQPNEVIVWLVEVFIVFLILALSEYLLFQRKDVDKNYLIKMFIGSILIVFILPIVGIFSTAIKYENRDFYPVGVVIVFALTAFIIHAITEEKRFAKTTLFTTILLVILFMLKIIFNIAIID